VKRTIYRALRILLIGVALMAAGSDAMLVGCARYDRMRRLPRVIVWAWQRRENLSFIDPDQTGVAYLAMTLELAGDRVIARPRFQPLIVPPRTALIAVARIESDLHAPPALSSSQRARAAASIAELADAAPAAIQVDFDAARSQRVFYRDLLADLRRRIPASMPLSITALASWCLEDDWISDLPVDEAVPMVYRMGPDGREITSYLRAGGRFTSPLSRHSIGLSLDAAMAGLSAGERVYLFSPQPWTPAALHNALMEIRK
jgi:hypothetical protein